MEICYGHTSKNELQKSEALKRESWKEVSFDRPLKIP
jgi:hypothetical protein